MDSAFLSLKEVWKIFGISHGSPVLAGITVTFQSSHTYAIEGISGTGKSTLMHIIAGLDIPSRGTILFNNQNLAFMLPEEKDYFLQHNIGLLFQQPYLIKELTVLENVIMPALIAGNNEEIAKKDALFLIESVGLVDKTYAKPGNLSGGQQQRVALARALINKPAFLLADEPTGNLDEQNAKNIVQIMHKLHRSWGMGIIVSTHDKNVVQAMQHRFVLVNGQLQSQM